MTDPCCWYINANIDWGYIDGIYGTPDIYSIHGLYHIWLCLKIGDYTVIHVVYCQKKDETAGHLVSFWTGTC
jgi:hypothetical protein